MTKRTREEVAPGLRSWDLIVLVGGGATPGQMFSQIDTTAATAIVLNILFQRNRHQRQQTQQWA